jgi:hypothetical protein
MGQRGPVPKREAERAGHRAKADKPDTVKTQGKVDAPPVDPSWHPRAAEMYLAVAESGQSKFFEPSDWALARVLCDQLTWYYESSRPSAELLKHVLHGFAQLGVTESDRRRQRIEVERGGNDESTAAADAIREQFEELRKAASGGA